MRLHLSTYHTRLQPRCFYGYFRFVNRFTLIIASSLYMQRSMITFVRFGLCVVLLSLVTIYCQGSIVEHDDNVASQKSFNFEDLVNTNIHKRNCLTCFDLGIIDRADYCCCNPPNCGQCCGGCCRPGRR